MDRGPITTVHSICDGEKLRPDRNNVALAALAEPIRSGRSDFCIFNSCSSSLPQNFFVFFRTIFFKIVINEWIFDFDLFESITLF